MSVLSGREKEVLVLVAEGLANKQIARVLGIAERTVKAHLTSVFTQIGVTDRTSAALWAHRRGLVSSPRRGPRTGRSAVTSTGSVGTADYPGRMLRRTDLRSRPLPPTAALRALLPRAEVDVDAVVERVRPIVEAVRERGSRPRWSSPSGSTGFGPRPSACRPRR